MVGTNNLGATGTSGGNGADAAHTYTVTNRNELIQALYTNAVINDDGSFTGTLDTTKKIIYVKGTITLSMNKALVELKEADYAAPGYSFDAYVAAYKPSVWNTTLDTTNKPKKPSGTQETLRTTSSGNQSKVVKVALGSNTSLIGLGSDARIIKGQISIGDGTDNVVVRNITFEDSFDYFPAWDPTDSWVLDTTKPGCQATYVDATTGPQMCPGGHWNSNYDTLSLSGGTHVWIDHCTFTDGDREDWMFPSVFELPHKGLDYVVEHHDGAVDITNRSNYVTLSYNHVKNHDKTHLIGGSDSVGTYDSTTGISTNGLGALSVTLHHNWWENAGQRLPRVRFGKVHVYDNYYSGQVGYTGQYAPIDSDNIPVPNNRFLYGMGIGYLSKIYSENNVFDIQDAPSGNTTKASVNSMFYVWHKASPTTGTSADVGQNTYYYDAGSVLNGAPQDIFAAANIAAAAASKPVLLSTDTVWKPSSVYSYTLEATTGIKAKVTANAGAGKL
ncbi:polysaccharide lyase family 1 protein [Uliginosibacterium sp. sgz301328]|uniref:pectate lyase family protein n=1 Tax=Uliginosibacterium sp. sgz301328 TaxID=3243764 RepID=UPI00359EA23F